MKQQLKAQGLTGSDNAEIDHIELIGPPSSPARANSRGFVLCPGNAYDRSPCGTGTSAKIACLAEDGKLQPGETYCHESVIGSLFEAKYRRSDAGEVIPTIQGTAHVNATAELLLSPHDPFAHGILTNA
jgi:4-hydroxyproline epimerase